MLKNKPVGNQEVGVWIGQCSTSWGCTPKVAVISSSWEKMCQKVSHLTLNVKNEPCRLRGGRFCTVMKSVSAIATTNQNQKQRKIWLKLVSDGKTDGRRDKAETVYHFLLQSWGISSIEVFILSIDESYLPVNSQGGCIIAQKLRTVGFDKTRNVETNIPDVDVWNKL